MKQGYLECSVCHGTGEDAPYVCQKCKGEGIVDWVTDIVYKKGVIISNLQLLNVRRAINYVRDTVMKALETTIFEPNTQFSYIIKPYLDNCISNHILHDYKVVDDTKDPTGKRQINIMIRPMVSLDMIYLNFKVEKEK